MIFFEGNQATVVVVVVNLLETTIQSLDSPRCCEGVNTCDGTTHGAAEMAVSRVPSVQSSPARRSLRTAAAAAAAAGTPSPPAPRAHTGNRNLCPAHPKCAFWLPHRVSPAPLIVFKFSSPQAVRARHTDFTNKLSHSTRPSVYMYAVYAISLPATRGPTAH